MVKVKQRRFMKNDSYPMIRIVSTRNLRRAPVEVVLAKIARV